MAGLGTVAGLGTIAGSGPAAGPGSLAWTGTDLALPLVGGLLAVLLGLALSAGTRRRGQLT